LLAEQKAEYEAKMRKQNDMYATELQKIASQQLHVQTNQPPKQVPTYQPQNNQPVNQILSGMGMKPKFEEQNTAKTLDMLSEQLSDQINIFDSDKDSVKGKTVSIRPPTSVRKSKNEIFDMLESLDDTEDIDISETFGTPKKASQSTRKNNSVTKSATRSVTRSTRKNGSDTMSTTRRKVHQL
jgi:hypothetical protein